MKIHFNKKCGNGAEKYDYKYDDFDPEEEIECTSCGAHYKKRLIKCPYCASTNLIGSEKAYMDKMTGMQDTMTELKKEDIAAAKEESKEILYMLRPIIIIVFIIAAIAVIVTVRNNIKKSQRTSEYLKWSRDTLPKLDEMYDKKQYEEIVKIYEIEELKPDSPIFTWEHCDFFGVLADVEMEYKYFHPDKIGTWSKYTYRIYLEEYCILKYKDYDTRFDHDNLEYIKNKYSDYESELAVIYPFTKKDDDQFLNSYKKNNYVDIKLRDLYLKKYFKKYNIKKGVN